MQIDKGLRSLMWNGYISISISPCSTGEDIGRLISLTLVFIVGEVGRKLHNYVLLIDPKIVEERVVWNCVFGNDFRIDLVGPIDLQDSMVVGQDKQKLVIKVAGVNTQTGEA